VSEHVARFGEWRSLVGVVTEPDAAQDAPECPTLLFLNAGLLHHVGPNRLHVRLARRLGAQGFRSFRFDLSGIGDSAPREDRMPRAESIVSETREAMDYLERHRGARQFVLFGICSGAEQACLTTLADARVVGNVLVDGYRYRTGGFYVRHYGRRLLRPRSWKSVLTGRHPTVARFVAKAKGSRPDLAGIPPSLLAPFPPRRVAEATLREHLDRAGSLLLVYTQGPLFNHRAQFRSMFPTLATDSRVRMEFLEHANHLFTLRTY